MCYGCTQVDSTVNIIVLLVYEVVAVQLVWQQQSKVQSLCEQPATDQMKANRYYHVPLVEDEPNTSVSNCNCSTGGIQPEAGVATSFPLSELNDSARQDKTETPARSGSDFQQPPTLSTYEDGKNQLNKHENSASIETPLDGLTDSHSVASSAQNLGENDVDTFSMSSLTQYLLVVVVLSTVHGKTGAMQSGKHG